MISTIFYAVCTAIIFSIIGFKIGQRRTFAAAVEVQRIMEEALHNLVDAHAGLTEANEEMILLHSSHVGFVLDALDEHVRYTGKKLDPDAQHVIDQIRPYYASETIH